MRAVKSGYIRGVQGQKVTAIQRVTMPLLALGLFGQGVGDQAREQPGHQSHHSVRLVRLSGARQCTGAKGLGPGGIEDEASAFWLLPRLCQRKELAT